MSNHLIDNEPLYRCLDCARHNRDFCKHNHREDDLPCLDFISKGEFLKNLVEFCENCDKETAN